MFAFRALTGAKYYQNLERECLATIWGMEKFHYFLYGKQFTLEMDQKPLVAIYKKHMVEISPRIQHLVIRSFLYQPFDVKYWRGVDIPLDNTLSSITPLPTEEDGIQLPIIMVNQITVNIPCSSNNLDQICEETSKDLMLIADAVHLKWMASWAKAASMRTIHLLELSRRHVHEDGIANQRSQNSHTFHTTKETLQQIHKGHQGVEKCMLNAQESVFWPRISDDIHKAVERCGTCQSSSRAAKPLGSASKVPPHLGYTLGTDLFYWNKINFLMIGDYFTKFIIVERLPNSSMHSVTKELGTVFTKFGWLFMLRSDNGLCYSSKEFQEFLEFHQVHHVMNSPHHPQSNGFAKAFLGITKKLMEKAIKDGKPWNYGLLQYQVTLISSNIPSPLEALTGWRLRTSLPQIPSLIGKTVDSSRICQELIKRQLSTLTQSGMDLEPGQPVFIKEVQKTATIDQPARETDSYWVRYPDNSILRRTHQMIKPRTQPSHLELETQSCERNILAYRTPSNMQSFQTMFSEPGQQAFPTGKLAVPALQEPPSLAKRQDIVTSSPGSSGATPSTPVRRLFQSTKGILPRRYSPSRVQAMQRC